MVAAHITQRESICVIYHFMILRVFNYKYLHYTKVNILSMIYCQHLLNFKKCFADDTDGYTILAGFFSANLLGNQEVDYRGCRLFQNHTSLFFWFFYFSRRCGEYKFALLCFFNIFPKCLHRGLDGIKPRA